MKDVQNNQNNNEILPQNENITENELSRENEISISSEAVTEAETISDEEDNAHAKQTTGEEEAEDQQNDQDSEQGAESSSAGGAGSAAGAAGAAGASVAVIAAVVIVISAVVGSITAAFSKLDVFGTYFDYALTVTMEYTETEDSVIDFDNVDTGLVLMVTKNGFSKAIPLVTGTEELGYTVEKVPIADKENSYHVTLTFSGSVDGLSEGTRYKLAVIGDEDGKTVTYAKEEIKTTSRVTEFRGINSHCTCDKDGFFHFTVDFTDENDFYTDFIYEFRNTDGEIVRSGEISDPRTEQLIQNVNELPGSDYILIVQYKSSAPTDLQAENSITSYNDGDVIVEIDKGTVTITCKVKI